MLQLFFFFLYPAIEIYALITLGRHTGGLFLVFWTFASAGLGVWVIKKQGRHCMNQLARDLENGMFPQEVLVDSILVFFAGILLILPGVISDIIGLLLLIPFARGLSLGVAAQTIERHYTASKQRGGSGVFKVFTVSSGGFSETQFFHGNTQGFPGQQQPPHSLRHDGDIIDADFTETPASDTPSTQSSSEENKGTPLADHSAPEKKTGNADEH